MSIVHCSVNILQFELLLESMFLRFGLLIEQTLVDFFQPVFEHHIHSHFRQIRLIFDILTFLDSLLFPLFSSMQNNRMVDLALRFSQTNILKLLLLNSGMGFSNRFALVFSHLSSELAKVLCMLVLILSQIFCSAFSFLVLLRILSILLVIRSIVE